VTVRKKQEISRRHTEGVGNLWVAHTTAFFRRRLGPIVTTTLAVIRLKGRLAKRSKPKKSEEREEEEESLPPTPTVVLVRCNICNHTHDLSNAPDVVRVHLPPFVSSFLSHPV
jgi:hypothetical protein